MKINGISYIDENTGETFTCPFCESSTECIHLIGTVSTTFSELSSDKLWELEGQFQTVLEAFFLECMGKGLADIPDIENMWLDEIYQDILEEKEEYLENKYVDFNNDYLSTHAFVESLDLAGFTLMRDYVNEPQMPGNASAYIFVYAQEKEQVSNIYSHFLKNTFNI